MTQATPRATSDPSPAVATGAGPRAELPIEVRVLLAREGLVATSAREVTAVPGRWSRRRTFRVEVNGGRPVKARIVTDSDVAVRMERWLPLLAPRGFAPLLATSGPATLEAWIDGPLAPREDPETAESAGALLAACHAVLPLERMSWDDARLEAFAHEVEGWLRETLDAGHLTAGHAARVRAALRASRPRAATWGLRHGDFHPDNLVLGPSGLCCVDNTSIRPGVVELDLGFACNRWPLRLGARERFLLGYRTGGDPTRFLSHETFWGISAALGSGAWRARERADGIEVPLRELARHAP